MSDPQGGEQGEFRPSPDQQFQAPGGPPQYPPPGYPQQGYPQQGYWPASARRPNDGLAIASMVLGIVWIYWVGSILAVIFGHVALRRIARDGKSGRGMAIAGLVLGYLGIAVLAIIIVAAIAAAHSSGTG